MGNKLLTARAGLFVSNSDDHIKIELSSLDAAFQIKGSTGKVIERKNKTIFMFDLALNALSNVYLTGFSNIYRPSGPHQCSVNPRMKVKLYSHPK